MARPSIRLEHAAALLVGIVLGAAFTRQGRPLAAQVPKPAPVASQPRPDVGPVPAITGRVEGDDALYRQLARQYEQFASVNRTFELVSKAVAPAVVHIVSHKTGVHENNHRYEYDETGSGVVVRGERGRGLFVLTNNHVVEGSATDAINIFLHDGRTLKPSQAWLDGKADIAVLKLAVDDVPAARLGDSDDASVGSWVLAMGSPFGLTHSVTQGIISARGRHEQELQDDGVENQDFLQTDAAINPGNSGGPLVNLKGEVIGINTAIASNGGGSEGVGFSIPINLAKWIMGQLVANGKVARGAIGVDLDEVLPDRFAALGLRSPRGALVLDAHKGSPAQKGGVRDGDVIVRFNSIDVIDLNHLIIMVSMAPIGKSAKMVVWRDRQEVALDVVVADRDAVLASALPDRSLPPPESRRQNRPSPAVDANSPRSPR